ncbi:zinc finger protein VAR3, chloroplastic-like [Coffea eugenioides]|uniref:zinc finger protein VAR3, chloroplastic-like n=1 Tax=Coffea eugenioides TaxID=49369 RepID=UPI000F6065B3|nr:zinc finger protein VAR3, chloroplastic-like [Coffea eugenioides]
MLKFLRSKIHLQNPKLYIPISHVHSKTTSKYTPLSNPAIDFILNEAAQDIKPLKPSCPNPPNPQKTLVENEEKKAPFNSTVQISHPWPEWVELMDKLLKGGYFDQIGHPFGRNEMGSKFFNQIRTACLNYARDRFDLIRFLSQKDIQIVAGSGCPTLDRKVVNSGKRLRAHVGTDEGNVCSSCVLRGNCERAFVKAREDEGGRTVDVMRFLLTYGLDAIIGTVENEPCLNKKVKESVRKLLKEITEFSSEETDTEQSTASTSGWISSTQGISAHQGQDQVNVIMKPGDWKCPKCNFLNFSRNIKCLRCEGLFQERLQKLGEDEDHLPLKKGDWICEKCNFLNFAKNTRCLQCKEKPSGRQLIPGEWECESCNYINFRRNMVCLKCDHKRPKASNSSSLPSPSASDHMPYRRTRPYFGQEKQCGDEESDVIKFVETEGQHRSNSLDEAPGFVDFPLVCGKSDLSQNVQKQERWRKEMAEQSRSAAKAKENAGVFKSSITRDSRELLQLDDDEEMAEWFGRRRDN